MSWLRRFFGLLSEEEQEVLQLIQQAAKDRVTRLDLSYKGITKLPAEIGQLTNLSMLHLSVNQLSSLPAEIGGLTNLTTLSLGNNQLSSLPAEIWQLTNLTTLSLFSNQLSSLPAEIGGLTNLTTLLLGDNQLSSLPAEIGQLTNLTTLRLSNNQLSSLPKEVGRLTNLTTLSLPQNICPECGDWIELGHAFCATCGAHLARFDPILDLRGNQLTTLPPEITELTNLKKLDLRDNPLPIPPEILSRIDDPATILDYYFGGRKTPLNEAKLVFVGEGRVGKTSLVRRLVEGQFDEYERITEGIAIRDWKVRVGEGEVKLNIWDFGGQEIMHATHQFFLTLRSLYVLVLDVQKDEVGNRLAYWLKLIESFGAGSPIIVVSNQVDQPRKLYLNQGELLKNYPNIKAFVNTSCKTGQGVTELGGEITRLIGSLAHVRDEIPIEWLAVKRQLEGLGKDYVAYDDYVGLCQANDIRQEREQRVLIRLLHDLGVVLNFQDDPRLSDTSVLNPAWVTGAVYRIINAKQIAQNRGILDIGQLDQILDRASYPKEMDWFILLMMRKFELCFDLAGYTEEKFLIPDLLPRSEPKLSWYVDCLNFEFIYDFLPRSIISRFMVRMNDFIFQETYWHHGMILVHNANRAVVKALPRRKKILISISGARQGRREFWQMIREQLEEIQRSIKGLNATVKIPVYIQPTCPTCNTKNRVGAKFCRLCGFRIPVASDKKPHCQDCGANNRVGAKFCTRCGLVLSAYSPPAATVDYGLLLTLQAKGIEQYPVPVGDDVVVVNVRELLEGVKPAPKVVEREEIGALKKILEGLRVRVHPQRVYDVTFLLGQLYYEEMNDYTLARQALVDGHEAIEALRGMVQEAIQVRLSAESVKLYEMLVRCYLEEGDEGKAFEYAAAAKGRAFVNRLAEARVDLESQPHLRQPEFASKLALARQKRQEIDQLESQISAEEANRDQLKGQQSVLLREEAELWREMARDYPALTATLTVPSLSAEQARELARELDATLVEYYRHSEGSQESGWCAFVVTADGIRYVRLPALNKKLLQQLLSWRNHVHQRQGRSQRRLKKLDKFYAAAVAPLALNSTRLIFAPFLELHLLPFAAARQGKKRYLVEDHLVSYIPSLTALYVLNEEQKRHQEIPGASEQAFSRLLSVAYPGTPPLPNVLAEAEVIAKSLSGIAQVDLLHEEAATPLNVLKYAAHYDVIHFGCHGSFDEHDPTQSGLELAQKPLTVSEIITKLSLKRTRLTTLAACLTGEVALREGEEHIGLLQAMMTAGVRTVVASLWPVDDAATRALFHAFYIRFAQGYAPQEAMRDACHLLREASAWQHPFFWASFAVNGLAEKGEGRGQAWPPAQLAAQINIYQRQSTQQRGETMTDQELTKNAELLLHDLQEEREEVLTAFQQYPLSSNIAQQNVPNHSQAPAVALYQIVQDNPALQDFLPPPEEMARLRISPKHYQQARSEIKSTPTPQVVENSVSDYYSRLIELLREEDEPTNQSQTLLERLRVGN